ncbi:MAG: hypothetical protein DWQ07_22400 [Chloroflexi bacterium]|nr:MAG: hypothetical protein DWQ07_22400 [Chloroflexota bacterium]MBL1193900.1 hypothetical protein [Chloroflexota bacterium]NOH11194.1 hypothetical protein [Chloroflexota bacterium]
MRQKILNKDLKTFVIWWLLLAVVSWFGPLIFVLGILGKHHDQEAWQIVLVLTILLTVIGQYLWFRWWFRRSGLGAPAIYLPPQSMHWVAAAFGLEFLVFIGLDFVFGNAIFGDYIFTPYYLIWSWIPMLLFRRPKRGFPPASWLIISFSFLAGLLGRMFLNLFFWDDALEKILRPLPSPIVWFVSLGFLAACVKGALFLVGFQRWPADSGVEEDIKDRRHRRITMLSMAGVVVFFILFGFAFPRGGPQFLGLQPCGWLDLYQDRSHCVQAWYLGRDMDSPALSPDGQWLATYEEVLQEVQIRSVTSGELIARRSFEEFIAAKYPIPNLFFSPDGSLLLFSERDSGAYLWDIAQDQLVPVAPMIDAYPGAPTFSSDGGELAFSVDGDLVIWDTQTHQIINQIERPDYSQFEFLEGEETVLMMTQKQVLRWDYLSSQPAVLVEDLGERDPEIWSRHLFDAEGTVYTVLEIEDQFYLAYDDQFLLLPLAGTEVADLVQRAPAEFATERPGSGISVYLEVAISPNGDYLALLADNWLSVHRTTDGAALFWANPCGRDDGCYMRDLQVLDEGFVLIPMSRTIQIWSVQG